jgi:phage shock protein C
MITCPKCKEENNKHANFCFACGTKLKSDSYHIDINKNIKHFEEEIDRFGKKLADIFDDAGENIGTWYDRAFGPFGPVLISIFSSIILLIILQLLIFFGEQRPWLIEIQLFLEPILILFIIVFLISTYSQYLTKKIKPFRFVSPIISVLIFIFWFWVALNIIAIIGAEFEVSILITFKNLFELLLIPIALIILIVGYANIISNAQKPVSNQQIKKKSQSESVNTTQDQVQKHDITQEEYKRLYRSGKDQIVGGVLGGIAEYLNIDPTLIRVLFVIILIASFGTMVLAYLIGWIIIPRNPNHQWK